MTEQRSDEIRTLCDDATPGPWFVASREGDDEGWWIWADPGEPFSVDPFTVALLAYDGPDGGQASHDEREQADAEFIAAARELVPSLLAERDSLRGVVQAAEAERDQMRKERDAYRIDRDWFEQTLREQVAAAATDAPQPQADAWNWGGEDLTPAGPSPAVLPQPSEEPK